MSRDADAPRMSKGPSTLYTGGSIGSVKPRASILMTDWNGWHCWDASPLPINFGRVSQMLVIE